MRLRRARDRLPPGTGTFALMIAAVGIAFGGVGVALAGPAIPAVGRRFAVEPVTAQTV